ncbi:3-ketodihydrosphingosine reductase, partial [Pseudolycoriella hygida]
IPEFENEIKFKPQETTIISASAGLSNPADVADQLVCDSLSGNFMSIYGYESWILAFICSGMAPWGGFLFTLLQSLVVGPLRFVVYGFRQHCEAVVKSCERKRRLGPGPSKTDVLRIESQLV